MGSVEFLCHTWKNLASAPGGRPHNVWVRNVIHGGRLLLSFTIKCDFARELFGLPVATSAGKPSKLACNPNPFAVEAQPDLQPTQTKFRNEFSANFELRTDSVLCPGVAKF